MKGNKWILLVAALIMLAVTWLGKEPESLSQLSAGDLLPILAVSAVIFLVKTGVLSALLLLIKKLWDKFRKKS